MRMTLEELTQGLSALGDLHGREEMLLTRIEKDSRMVRPGDVFACIAGNRFDGHSFAREAVRRGAAAVIGQRPLVEIEGKVPVLLVRDTVNALGRLAAFWRERTKARVVGITGSAGKTTLKEMLSCVLSRKGKTSKNYKNWNNQLGLALSILSTEGDETFWVMEAGISIPGDMEELAVMLRPDLAVIPNVGPAHLERLGSLEGVAREKTRLLDFLAPGGQALISMDHPPLFEQAEERMPGSIGFSTRNDQARFHGGYLGSGGQGNGRFSLSLDGTPLEVELPFWGGHMGENVLATAAAATLLGLSPDEIGSGLACCTLPEQRFQTRRVGSWMFIDDTYNANPLSMRCSIQAAQELDPQSPLVLVIGEMAELGAESSKEHRQLGEYIASSGCRCVLFSGRHAGELSEGLAAHGWSGTYHAVESAQGALDLLRELNLPGGTILFKGSRCCSMDTYFNVFCKEFAS
jgi:UDP-N-acetylmuramoyl-tripeptide--D-alanyl-D-alanine ligase